MIEKLTFEQFMAIWIPYGIYFGILIWCFYEILIYELRR